MPEAPIRWTEEPIVVAPGYLRWALMRGMVDGTTQWVLREDSGREVSFHVLDVTETPAPEDLVSELAPTMGLPIAEALVVEARRRLPHSVFCIE